MTPAEAVFVEDGRATNELDVRLARAAASGSLADWHDFVLRYSGLVLSVVRRYLADFDQDAQRDTYVSSLENLLKSGLARYDGSTTLASWVIIVTRSRCMDARRAINGRVRPPVWLSGLSERDQEIYRLYFIERMDTAGIEAELARRGHALESHELDVVLDAIEAKIDRRTRTRLAYEVHARSTGQISARLLEYFDHSRHLAEERGQELQPDAQLIEQQARDVVSHLHASLERLPDLERQALELRYQEGLTAGRIATQLGLPNRRTAQAVLERAIASLRSTLRPANKPTQSNRERRDNGRGRHP